MSIFSETSPVVTKRNPSRKQYGLSRLPVDRKQAYLQETAQQDQKLHSTQSDQCEVEYDSDEDTNVSNANLTNTINTKPVDTSNNDDDDKLNSVHKETKKPTKDDNDSVEKLNLKVAEEEDKSVDSEALQDNVTIKDDNSREVVSPKRTKMIGPSLGPLRKRRRRSSEVCACVHMHIRMYVHR